MRFFIRISDPAIRRIPADVLVFKTHRFYWLIAVLNFKALKIYAFLMYSRGCARLKSAKRKTEIAQTFLKFRRGVHPVGSPVIIYVSDKDPASEKSPCRNDRRADFIYGAQTCLDLRNLSVFRPDTDYLILFNIKIFLLFKRFFH